jgi:hypothetical protein
MARAQTFTAPARPKLGAVAFGRRPNASAPGARPEEAKSFKAIPPVLPGALDASAHADLLRPALRGSRTSLTCRCGEPAVRVECTRGEMARFGGERFARAFLCHACGQRYVGRTRPGISWLR